MIFKQESIVDLFKEGLDLMREHEKEVPSLDAEFNISQQRYIDLEDAGNLICFSARTKVEKLIGYAIFLLNEDIRYGEVIIAIQDSIYIHPEYRGNNGTFIEWIDDRLAEYGVHTVHHLVKTDHDWSKLLIAKGYRHAESIYTRRLT